jgi:hypothetical protein
MTDKSEKPGKTADPAQRPDREKAARKKRRPYEPPTLKLVDLARMADKARQAMFRSGAVIAQSPTSTSNATGSFFGSSASGAHPSYFGPGQRK